MKRPKTRAGYSTALSFYSTRKCLANVNDVAACASFDFTLDLHLATSFELIRLWPWLLIGDLS
jgi:hypothetical protein